MERASPTTDQQLQQATETVLSHFAAALDMIVTPDLIRHRRATAHEIPEEFLPEDAVPAECGLSSGEGGFVVSDHPTEV